MIIKDAELRKKELSLLYLLVSIYDNTHSEYLKNTEIIVDVDFSSNL